MLFGVLIPGIGPPVGLLQPFERAEVGVEVGVGDVRVGAALDRVGDVGRGHFAVDRRAEVHAFANVHGDVLPPSEISGATGGQSGLGVGERVRLVRVKRALRGVRRPRSRARSRPAPGRAVRSPLWLSTVSVPPRLPPVCASRGGVWIPSATADPAAARDASCWSCRAARRQRERSRASAARREPSGRPHQCSSLLLCVECPSSRGPRVQSVLQAIAQQVEGEHRQQQRDAGKDHVPPGGVEDRRRRGDHLPPAGGRRADADAEEREARPRSGCSAGSAASRRR